MKFSEFKKKYKDLVFCPLPYAVPDINEDKLYKWIENNKDCEYNVHKSFGGELTQEEFDKAHTSKLSFFNSYFLLTGTPGNKSTWYNEFDTQFPEFATFVESIPLIGEPQFGFITQKPYNEMDNFNPHRVSNIHVDELGGFGIRMYINSYSNNLLFYGLKNKDMHEHVSEYSSMNSIERYNRLDSAGNPVFDGDIQLANDAFYQSPVRTNLKTSNQVFFINGSTAAHYVEHEHTDNKLTFLIMGRSSIETRYDWGELSESIEKIKLTREDEFLYYNDLCN